MKNIVISTLLLLISLISYSTNYTVSSKAEFDAIKGSVVGGDTIKIVSGTVITNDYLYFSRSGIEGNPIVITTTGEEKAWIDGSVAITGWTNIGGNIWEANYATEVYQLFRNDTSLYLGMTPEYKGLYAVDGNVHKITSVQNENYTFTCTSLIGMPDLVGATLQAGTWEWDFFPAVISAFNSTTGQVTVATDIFDVFRVGTRFIILNHPNLVTSEGYWYQDLTEGKIRMYSSSEPQNIKGTVLNNRGFYLSNASHVVIHNIGVRNVNTYGFEISNASDITLDNIASYYARKRGVHILNGSLTGTNQVVRNSHIIGSLDVGINIFDGNSTIENNLLEKNALSCHLNKYNEYVGIAISARDSSQVINNRIYDNGYNGISLSKNASAYRNIIKYFNLTTIDGSGIYSYEQPVGDIKYNTIINYPGIIRSNGIYMDNGTSNAVIEHNTIIDAYTGLAFNSPNTNHKVRFNNVYNPTYTLAWFNASNSLIMKQNKFFVSGENNVLMLNIQSSNSSYANIATDSNYYFNNMGEYVAYDGGRTIRENSFQASTTNTITLDVGASGTNNAYYDRYISIMNGSSTIESREIIDYNGTTKVATVQRPWTTIPDPASRTYKLRYIPKQYGLERWSALTGNDVNSHSNDTVLPRYNVTSVISTPLEEPFNTVWTAWSADRAIVEREPGNNCMRVIDNGSSWGNVTKNNITINQGSDYVLSFDMKVQRDCRSDIHLKDVNTGIYPIRYYSLNLSPGWKSYKIYIPNIGINTINAELGFYVSYDSNKEDTMYLDNVKLEEVIFDEETKNHQIVYNYSPNDSTIELDGVWTSLDNVLYDSEITLEPYSSEILLKTGLSSLPQGIVSYEISNVAANNITRNTANVNYEIIQTGDEGIVTDYGILIDNSYPYSSAITGETSVGGTAAAHTVIRMAGMIAQSTGEITGINVLYSNTTVQNLRVAIYDHNSTLNLPDALLGQSDIYPANTSDVFAYYYYPLQSPISIVQGDTFWIALCPEINITSRYYSPDNVYGLGRATTNVSWNGVVDGFPQSIAATSSILLNYSYNYNAVIKTDNMNLRNDTLNVISQGSTISGYKTINANNLEENTRYYVKPYIIYGDTVYGDTLSFVTLTAPTPIKLEYLLNESSGVYAYSQGGDVAEVKGSFLRHRGVSGNALSFTNGYINAGSVINEADEITVSVWVKIPNPTTGFQGLVIHGGDYLDTYAVYINYSDRAIAFKTSGTTLLDINHDWLYAENLDYLWDGTWHLITATYDGAIRKIYVDTKLVLSSPAQGKISSGVGYNLLFGVGRDEPNVDLFFDGIMDNVRIFNYAITQHDVLYYYNNDYKRIVIDGGKTFRYNGKTIVF